ncbi:P-loop containing nucleoside triphosphate hydrolase protein [Scheffersomyces coipomensis]|uniref:P-loop containing nucleoside triphosphate hydrolase protein n=1 Tax=Scheffersomyces coipomensis TaxID=1788519 RepID=UPI00315D157F
MNSILALKDSFDILVIGDHQVGKSSLIQSYLHETFIPNIDSSLEDLHTKVIGDHTDYYELSILDTSSVTDSFARSRQQQIINASTLLLVYSITDTNSIMHLHDIYDRIQATRPILPPVIVVGSKADLVDERQVTWEEGHEFSQSINATGFFECSSKDNSHVQDAFLRLSDIVLAKHQSEIQNQKRSKSITPIQPIETNNTIDNSIIMITSEVSSTAAGNEKSLGPQTSITTRQLQQKSISEPINKKSGCCTIM